MLRLSTILTAPRRCSRGSKGSDSVPSVGFDKLVGSLGHSEAGEFGPALGLPYA